MRVLVIGGGGREHAIAWKLSASPRVDAIVTAPGNAGTAQLGVNAPVAVTDPDGLVACARDHAIDLTVVGPEAALEAGVVDRFRDAGLRIVGPTQAAARIETSKAFAKRLMTQCGVPTARAETFDDYTAACAYVDSADGPLVVKADGLAAGKGVRVCDSREEARDALRDAMVSRAFGDAGRAVVIEERLTGQEISAFAFTDGVRLSPLVAACDYKRAFDGDGGPNTGGMGSYSPPAFWNDALAAEVTDTIMAPIVRGLANEGCPYTGILYCGLMLTAGGPKVIEFNARLGDPETQAILPRMDSDLLDVLLAVAEGDVSAAHIRWSDACSVGVTLASGGYPGDYATGYPVSGLEDVDPDVAAFHAGTALDGAGRVVTAGGRVLTVTATGPTLDEARARAYANAARIHFTGAMRRSDIAALTAAPIGGS